jgi:nucleotide-binding universal stress UspA family protein
MVQLEKILLPVDFSERSVRAAQYAKVLACRFHSEVTMLHVLSPLDYVMGGIETAGGVPQDWYFTRRDEARMRLDKFLPDEFRTLPVRRMILEGDPATEIVNLAHTERMNLIVLPTHGYGPFRRFIVGSVTAKVLHDADCPVLTGVHIAEAPAMEPLFFRNLVCAVDFGPQSVKAFSWAAEMAAEFQARLTLVHAVPRLDSSDAPHLTEELAMIMERQAREEMEEIQARAGVKAEVSIDSGKVSDVVRQAAESCHADLVVIGRHETLGAAGRLRSNAYAIVRESPCPVVSV